MVNLHADIAASPMEVFNDGIPCCPLEPLHKPQCCILFTGHKLFWGQA